MLALDGDEQVELEPKETIAERIKLNPRKRRATGTRLHNLNTNKLLSRLPILSAQIKTENNSSKLSKSPKYCIFSISIIKSPKSLTTIY